MTLGHNVRCVPLHGLTPPRVWGPAQTPLVLRGQQCLAQLRVKLGRQKPENRRIRNCFKTITFLPGQTDLGALLKLGLRVEVGGVHPPVEFRLLQLLGRDGDQ